MAESPVVIVGAGASGLSAAGALTGLGIKSVLLEQDRQPGGTWAKRYDRLHLHTVRGFSGLAHYPIPSTYPKYLSRDEFAAYLQDYARHFHLNIKTGCEVRKVWRGPNAPSEWIVQTSEEELRCPVIVIATGQYRVPILPNWPGQKDYRGKLVHSADYANAAPFKGKRVLVVGLGNSGAEIATDLLEGGAAQVTLSVRTSPAVVPRDPFGMPVQRTGILLSYFPTRIADFFGWLTSRLVLGDLTRYGLPAAEWLPYSAKRVPVIDVGFVDALKQGRVKIRPALKSLTNDGAIFADGSSISVDVVIVATGFDTGLGDLIEAPGLLNSSNEPIAKSGEATAQPGIFFMGYIHSLRGHIYEANLASRKLAKNIERYLEERN